MLTHSGCCRQSPANESVLNWHTPVLGQSGAHASEVYRGDLHIPDFVNFEGLASVECINIVTSHYITTNECVNSGLYMRESDDNNWKSPLWTICFSSERHKSIDLICDKRVLLLLSGLIRSIFLVSFNFSRIIDSSMSNTHSWAPEFTVARCRVQK